MDKKLRKIKSVIKIILKVFTIVLDLLDSIKKQFSKK